MATSIEVDIYGEGWDVVTLLNVIYHESVNPLTVLTNALGVLRPGGSLIVSGPSSSDSFATIEEQIRAQLDADGVLKEFPDSF